MIKNSFFCLLLTMIGLTPACAQVRPMVFVPVTNGYNSARDGSATLKNGDKLEGKFLFHKPIFSSKKFIKFYSGGNKKKFLKYKLEEFQQLLITGKSTKNIYAFESYRNTLIYVDKENDTLAFCNRSLRKLK